MIEYKKGNIFNGDEDIICHQVNTFGIMGAGLAAQIKERFPEAFKAYEAQCFEWSSRNINPLGRVAFCNHYFKPLIANLFSQRDMTTDYMALRSCLKIVRKTAEKNNLSVALPYRMGCGIAHGDWNTVEEIIKEIFEDSNIKCVIYQLENVQ